MRIRILKEMVDDDVSQEAVERYSRSDFLQELSEDKDVSCIPQGGLAKRMQRIVDSGGIFCSFEFTPPSEAELLISLLSCVKRLQTDCSPLFNAITCHSNGMQGICPPGIRLAQEFKSNQATLLHMVGTGLREPQAYAILKWAQSCGIKSIFALQGDTSRSEVLGPDFPHAEDLVRFIKECYGDYFTICVAGYPDMHPQSLSQEEDIYHLKQKVMAGADFIITQVIFESKPFVRFVKMCRLAGIEVPIIPGIFAVPSYASLVKMATVCKLDVPETMLRDLERIKENEQTVINYCIFKSVETVKHLLKEKIVSGIHFFTLNRELVTREICLQVGFCLPVPGQMEIFWKATDTEIKFNADKQQTL